MINFLTDKGFLLWLVDKLKKCYNDEDNSFVFYIYHKVYRIAYCVYYGITKYKFYVAQKHVIYDIVLIYGNYLHNYKFKVLNSVKTFFTTYFFMFGDHMPYLNVIYLL